MNEVTKIHLGRQAFTIANDAHKELRNYLAAIKDQVSNKDVMEEVELRMAELLAEHGISGDKVILPQDVDFLKSQLGNPTDFNDDSEAVAETKSA
jgi:translation elongation factor EF-Tu-like GTPase